MKTIGDEAEILGLYEAKIAPQHFILRTSEGDLLVPRNFQRPKRHIKYQVWNAGDRGLTKVHPATAKFYLE